MSECCSYSTLLGRGLAGAAITCASGTKLTLATETAAPPSMPPTPAPTAHPTSVPTAPTYAPTTATPTAPTYAPTGTPSVAPTSMPTFVPTYMPTSSPTLAPSSAQPTRSYAVNFRGCTNSVLQAQSSITFAGEPTYLTGDIGIAPGTAITADYVAGHVGTTHHTDAYAMTCAADTAKIAAQAAGQMCQKSIPSQLGKNP